MRSTTSMSAFNFVATCFSPSRPTGRELPVEIMPGSLVVCLEDGERQTVPLASVRLHRGGFSGRQWQFSWQGTDGNWSVTVNDAAVQQRLQTRPPAGLERQLDELQHSGRKGRWLARLGWSLLLLIVLAPVALLGLFWWQADRVAGWALDHIDIAQERELGEQVFASQKAGLRLVQQPVAQQMLADLGGKLTQGSTYHYDWYISDDPSLNAFALPGGIVVVNSGLIQASATPEELAGVLAHEVQHVERRHSLRAMVKNLGLQGLLQFALGDYSGTVTAQMAQELSQLRFSRDHEREADQLGFASLTAADIDPHGMMTIFERLQAADRRSPPALLSSHPATADRIAALKDMTAKLPAHRYPRLTYPWAKIKAALPK